MNSFEKLCAYLNYDIEEPTCYGIFHIICLLITLLIVIYLFKRKEKNHEKSLKRVLAIFGISVFILELLKQVIWSFDVETLKWHYMWYAAPFQLCTTPIYVSLICLFLKKGKLRDSLLSFMAYFTILGSIATAVYPESCFVETLLVDIHTMILHLGALVVSLYLLKTKEVDNKFKTFINGYKVFLVFVLIAEILNIIIYKSGILHGDTFNMFYISPYFESSLPIFSTVQQKVPFIIFLLFYLFMIFMGGLIVFGINKLVNKK